MWLKPDFFVFQEESEEGEEEEVEYVAEEDFDESDLDDFEVSMHILFVLNWLYISIQHVKALFMLQSNCIAVPYR